MEIVSSPSPPLRGRVFRTISLWLRTVRLAAAILLEGMYSLLQLLTFPWRRRRERARIAAVIQGAVIQSDQGPSLAGRGAASWLLVASLCVASQLLPGCQSERPMPGSSFSNQVEQTLDSTLDLIDMSDARTSLREDLYAMAEMEPADELLWDLRHLFTAPDARESLASDLKELSDPELGALVETCEMFGW